jgi:hypothetical protein
VTDSQERLIAPWLRRLFRDICITLGWLIPNRIYGWLPIRIYCAGAVVFTVVWLLIAKDLPSVGG